MRLRVHPEFLDLSKRQRYLLAISGGRDSVALLYSMLDAGYNNLVLCHLNHGLRGNASGQDAAFVRRLAKKLDLPCEVGRMDIAQQMNQSGDSMELAARKARHVFFAQCATLYRCPRVLLGHHADDQAETIIFNLLRGSGGLKGMQWNHSIQVGDMDLTLLRPLLLNTRSEIDSYVKHHRLHYREDTTNAEPIAARNRLRNEVMPLLSDIMGRDITPGLLRALNVSEAKHQALHETLVAANLTDPQGRLFLPKLLPLSPALQLMALQEYLQAAKVRDINHDLLTRCLSLLTDPDIAKINLPGGLFFRRKAKRLFISN